MTTKIPTGSVTKEVADGRRHNNTVLYAHRGSTVLAPENTLPAFELALFYQADILEIDVRLSRDGHVVVIHDDRIDRTCDGAGLVRDLSLSKLQTFNAAARFSAPDGIGFDSPHYNGKRYTGNGVRLMSLQELFEQFPDTPINIDIKDNAARGS